MKHSADIIQANRQLKIECCVLCGAVTEYACDTSVAERECFVVGCGQLCRKCYEEVSKDETEILIVSDLK